ncbi:hypothetical protein Q3G72_015106 [Acer saccharum]|nr:hypothetical protein Q3G72_015106 [Acer saccharum]
MQDSKKALGVGRHKDPSALTVLAQDEVGGLEVRRKSNGAWISVKPFPDAFIINLGDATQVWSNDIYESAEHKVVMNSEKEWFSIPFFFYLAHYVMLKPLEEFVNEQNPARYREFNMGKFYVSRNRSDFKKHEVFELNLSNGLCCHSYFSRRFTNALARKIVNDIIQRTAGRIESLHSEGVHRISEMCCFVVSQLLMLGKSIIVITNKVQDEDEDKDADGDMLNIDWP